MLEWSPVFCQLLPQGFDVRPREELGRPGSEGEGQDGMVLRGALVEERTCLHQTGRSVRDISAPTTVVVGMLQMELQPVLSVHSKLSKWRFALLALAGHAGAKMQKT